MYFAFQFQGATSSPSEMVRIRNHEAYIKKTPQRQFIFVLKTLAKDSGKAVDKGGETRNHAKVQTRSPRIFVFRTYSLRAWWNWQTRKI